ncbi:hypothetical protein TrVE_jg13765 [Triparma verrucosa]|uniref:Protein kinase domain-containing protein n=1 Tax=Triparma verrucosa TaxID=1606542 RepID=A0A9W7CLK8_9STRA|nr:hypothetical protein TrVE_jg13765 [Triparma verrucosa]
MFGWLTGSAGSCGGLPYALDKADKAENSASSDLGERPSWIPFRAFPGHSTASSSSDLPSVGAANGGSMSKDVTVFKCTKQNLPQPQLSTALNHFSNAPKLLHPNLLKVLAFTDTKKESPNEGELIIVTERVVPLEEYMKTLPANGSSQQVLFGVYCLLNALNFITKSCNLCHGNVTLSSVYVTPLGEFKLFDYYVTTPIDPNHGPNGTFRSNESLVDSSYRSPERVNSNLQALIRQGPQGIDAFSLSVLIQKLYADPKSGTGRNVPRELATALKKMQDLNKRATFAYVLKCPLFQKGLVKIMESISLLPTLPHPEKCEFYSRCQPMIIDGTIPENISKYRLLPIILTDVNQSLSKTPLTEEARRLLITVLEPMFQSSSLLTAVEFGKTVSPLLHPLFTVNDRAVRGTLLKWLSPLLPQIDHKTLNKIFDPICSGFTDSSSPLRELTLKSTSGIVEGLTASNLEKLARYLVRLQADQEASIRTNTVIFIGKIAGKMTKNAREKLILPSFVRGMGDPFVFCRVSSLKAVRACGGMFGVGEVAGRVLPVLCPLLGDGSSEVRGEAFNVRASAPAPAVPPISWDASPPAASGSGGWSDDEEPDLFGSSDLVQPSQPPQPSKLNSPTKPSIKSLRLNPGSSLSKTSAEPDFFNDFTPKPVKTISNRTTGGLKIPKKKVGTLKVKKDKIEVKKLDDDPFKGLDGGWDDF